jgi:rhodanese-related sulfurtransferase
MTPSLEQLQSLEPISGLSGTRLEELARLSGCQRFALGTDPLALMRQGNQFLYLLTGELRLTLPDGSMQILVGGCDEAHWPIGYKSAPPSSSRAITEVVLLGLDFDLLDIMMTWDELAVVADATAPATDNAAWSTMSGAFSARVLTSCVLAQLPAAHIHELFQRLQRIPAKRGEYIVKEGEEAEHYFLVESGRCVVSREVGGVRMEVAELKPGDAFGEEALVADTLRGASVSMKTDGILLRLAKPDFIELLQEPLLRPVDRAVADTLVANGQGRWLDVRYPAEFAEDGLPGALNVPLNEIRAAFGLLDRSLEYIVYCQSGRRSSAAAFLLAQNGIHALWLKGGLGRGENP